MTPQQALQILATFVNTRVSGIVSPDSAVQELIRVQNAIAALNQYVQTKESSDNTERKRKK